MIHTFRGEQKWLSNFYPVAIKYNGNLFQSTEAAYMSAKNDDPEWLAFCMDPNNTPAQIKKKSHFITVRPNWDEIKLGVMEEVLRYKFFMHKGLGDMLLATGDQNLVEGTTWNDRYWGVDVTVTPNIGENNLGRLLMKLRKQLKSLRNIDKDPIEIMNKFSPSPMVTLFEDIDEDFLKSKGITNMMVVSEGTMAPQLVIRRQNEVKNEIVTGIPAIEEYMKKIKEVV